MKLLQIKQGQAVSLIQLNHPVAPLPHFDLATRIATRYKFLRYPQTFEEISRDEVVFELGAFRDAAIEKLSVFSDGVVVTTKANTSVIDDFLHDAFDWATNELGYLVSPHPPARRLYTTTLEVYLDVDLDKWCEPLSQFAGVLNSLLPKSAGPVPDYRPAGFYLNFDDPVNHAAGTGAFKLERRVAKPFDRNVYLSMAPLRTDDHVSLLQQLERLAKRR